eukprot:1492087-Rhodomonas_salina.2
MWRLRTETRSSRPAITRRLAAKETKHTQSHKSNIALTHDTLPLPSHSHAACIAGAFEFGDHVKISAEAQDFVTSLLQVDYAKRLTIDAALAHPWITTNLAAGKAHAHATRQAVLMPHGVKEKARPAPWLPMR